MNINLYTPFLEATRNVLQPMLDISEVEDRPSETFNNQETLDIVIEVIGDMTGEVIYRFPANLHQYGKYHEWDGFGNCG